MKYKLRLLTEFLPLYSPRALAGGNPIRHQSKHSIYTFSIPRTQHGRKFNYLPGKYIYIGLISRWNLTSCLSNEVICTKNGTYSFDEIPYQWYWIGQTHGMRCYANSLLPLLIMHNNCTRVSTFLTGSLPTQRRVVLCSGTGSIWRENKTWYGYQQLLGRMNVKCMYREFNWGLLSLLHSLTCTLVSCWLTGDTASHSIFKSRSLNKINLLNARLLFIHSCHFFATTTTRTTVRYTYKNQRAESSCCVSLCSWSVYVGIAAYSCKKEMITTAMKGPLLPDCNSSRLFLEMRDIN